MALGTKEDIWGGPAAGGVQFVQMIIQYKLLFVKSSKFGQYQLLLFELIPDKIT